MAKLVVIDTQTLIWGVKEQATPGQESMIARAKALLRNEEGNDLAVPAVAFGEFLVKVPAEHHPMVTNLAGGTYALQPFDAAAASQFARLFNKRLEDGTIASIVDGDSAQTRRKAKVDLMIIATAIANEADYIVSHDSGLKALADGEILVKDLPVGSEQMDLLGDVDDRE